MPRTSRIVSPVRQPGSISVRPFGSGRNLRSNLRMAPEKVLTGIMNSALDGVAVLRTVRNASGRVVDFLWIRINPAGERILGLKAAAVIGQSLLKTVPDAAHDGLLACWAAALETGETVCHEHRCEREGIEGWVEHSVAAVDDGVAVTFRDVTARRHAEAALHAARAEAARFEQVKTTFLALVNHELRTPLNGVLCALDLLAGSSGSDRDLLLDTALLSARELSKVVHSILNFADLDTGPAAIKPIAFDLHDLIENEAAAIAPAAAAKYLTVGYSLDPAVPRRLIGCPDALGQIVRTLLENAAKFTEAGSVDLILSSCPSSSPCDSTCRNPGIRDSGAMACFSLAIRDTGIGIDPKFHAGLFQAFYQTDSSLHRLHEGCGLGLAICSRLADRLGGTLSVQSLPGQGSVFRLDLSLPLARHPNDRHMDDPYPGDRHSGESNDNTVARKRILLADPSEASGMVTALMLTRAGFEVETVTGGLEALRLARLHRFDAVVIDMALPDMNGIMTVKALRRLPQLDGSVPILAITGNLDAYDDQRRLAAGATDLMVKPFRKSHLLGRLERLVRTASEP
jgi:PAS domain S-box-containing protein